MKLRLARKSEADRCYGCVEDARVYHRSLGFEQWRRGYPSRETILEDIAQSIGYAFVGDDDSVCGYCCIIVGEEPAYREIEGKWRTDRPYAVVHRLAFSGECRGSGLSAEAFTLIKAFCARNGIDAIRVDTQKENEVMRHILAREGFVYCGLIQFDGGPKLAYEWDRP